MTRFSTHVRATSQSFEDEKATRMGKYKVEHPSFVTEILVRLCVILYVYIPTAPEQTYIYIAKPTPLQFTLSCRTSSPNLLCFFVSRRHCYHTGSIDHASNRYIRKSTFHSCLLRSGMNNPSDKQFSIFIVVLSLVSALSLHFLLSATTENHIGVSWRRLPVGYFRYMLVARVAYSIHTRCMSDVRWDIPTSNATHPCEKLLPAIRMPPRGFPILAYSLASHGRRS